MRQPNSPESTPKRCAPRMTSWSLITLGLMAGVALVSPEQLQVVLYKSGLVTLGAVLAYWIDRALFPYARPHDCAGTLMVVGAQMRRALIVLACVLGLTLGL